LWSRLFGPVLICDLIRLTRRGSSSIFLARVLYVNLLLLVILLVLGIESRLQTLDQLWDLLRSGIPVAPSKAASFASHFFHVLLGTQLVAVVLLTPAYTAGAIAEDRERRLIDYLLASDLTNREIVLGKLLARLAHLGLVLLAGLPLLVVAQVVGGANPLLGLAGLVVAVLTMASLGALSILESILDRRPREAILRTYLLVSPYFLCTTVFFLFSFVTSTSTGSPLLDRTLDVIYSGNPLVPVVRLWRGMESGDSPDRVFVEVLADCAIFHGVVLAGCLGLSIRRLRSCLTDTPATPEERFARRLRLSQPDLDNETARRLAVLAHPPRASTPYLPPVTDRPILWKELHVEPAPLRWPRQWYLMAHSAQRYLTVYCGGMFTLILVLARAFDFPGDAMRFFATGFGGILICLLMVSVVVRAAGCLSGERERHTLDSLLITPLNNAAIVNSKWLGSLLCVRSDWLGLVLVWILPTLLGFIDWQALPFLFLASLSFTSLATSLGLCCSLLCRDTWRATVLAFAFLLSIGILPCFFGCIELTPVGVIQTLIGFGDAEHRLLTGVPIPEAVRALVGVFAYALLAAVLWFSVHLLFAPVTGRMPAGERKPAPLPSAPPGPLC
jgi:ABC-type transport system involved in multi-copper enzyme maturation permease subunit